MKLLLGLLAPVDRALQSRNSDLQPAMSLINVVMEEIRKLCFEAEFDKCIKTATDLLPCETNEYKNDPLPKRIRKESVNLRSFIVTGARGDGETHSVDSLKSTFFESIDRILGEMERMFLNNDSLHTAVHAMSNKFQVFLDLSALAVLQQLGITLPSPEELVVAKKLFSSMTSVDNTSDGILKAAYSQRIALPDMYLLAATVATLACSTAICESSFSTLIRIDRPNRQSMLHDRLQNLILLAFFPMIN